MGSTRGRTETPLAESLLLEGHEFDFFQAIRLLSRVLQDRKPIGRESKPRDEAVRLQSRLTLEFPASAIHEISRGGVGEPWHVSVAFMGLFGTHGVLPFFYTESMIQRHALKDTAMTAFFDLFNHRWISLFYRAWEKHSLLAAFESKALGRLPEDRIGKCVFDIGGLGTGGLQSRMRVSDFAVAYYAGLLAQRARSATGLEGVLRDYFGIAFEIVQFSGLWYRLEEGDRCKLRVPGIHNRLGGGAVLGDAVWDAQGAFEIRVGPLGYREFRSFLPGGEFARELVDLVTFYVGGTQAFRVRLILAGPEVPYPQLGSEGSSVRLGWDCWLRDNTACSDRSDAVFAEAA